jgi:DNA polymerase III sliding clamp (beta) subunit (PCNA family)
MNLKIKTTELQGMISKAIECVSNNKLIPITSLISIRVENKKLILATTDYTNYLYVTSTSLVECEDFEVSVFADTLAKLIQKMTSEYTEFIVNEGENILTIKGNGTYKMELPLDETGKPIKFPKKVDRDSLVITDFDFDVKISTIRSLINVNKSAMATDMNLPVLVNYYCGEQVITSNRKTCCWNPVNEFKKPMLISPRLMELLSVVSGDKITVHFVSSEGTAEHSEVVFLTDSDLIYAPISEGIETFPIVPLSNLINSEFNSMVTLPRKEILDVIDRLSLFVSSYDKKAINLVFSDEGLLLSSKKSSGSELVKCKGGNNIVPFSCAINIEFFQAHLSSQDSELVDIYYGSPTAIKLVSGDIINVIGLFNEQQDAKGA